MSHRTSRNLEKTQNKEKKNVWISLTLCECTLLEYIVKHYVHYSTFAKSDHLQGANTGDRNKMVQKKLYCDPRCRTLT